MPCMSRVLLLSLLIATPVSAQQGTFEIRSLVPETALKAASAALNVCRKNGYQVTVAVSDRAGHPLAVLRDRYAGPHSVQTAIDKAYTALTFKMDTRSFARVTEAGEASGIRYLPHIVALGGGLVIESSGSPVGAIGVSGAPGGEADEQCAKAGIEAIREELEF